MAALKLQKEIHVTTSDEKAIDVLAQAAPELSRQQIKQAMQKGAVWLKLPNKKSQKRLRRVTQPLKAGDKLFIYFDEYLLNKTTEAPVLIADERHYSIWHKPAGMLAQGTLYGDHCSLLFYVERNLKPHRNVFLVHRLDSAASGIMIIAHSEKAAAALSKLFQERQLTKHYQAIAQGLVDKNIHLINETLDGKEAITRITNIEHLSDGNSTLNILIETGRKHQIRRHLAHIGHPIIGDREYGAANTKEALQLTATELAFTCPLSQQQRHYTL